MVKLELSWFLVSDVNRDVHREGSAHFFGSLTVGQGRGGDAEPLFDANVEEDRTTWTKDISETFPHHHATNWEYQKRCKDLQSVQRRERGERHV